MPATRSTRKNRTAAKRTVMGVLDDNEAAAASSISSSSSVPTNKGKSGSASVPDDVVPGVDVPADLDGSNREAVGLLIDDLGREMRRRQDAVSVKAEEVVRELREVLFLGKVKLEKSVRKMTVRDFNQSYGCDLLSTLRTIASADSAGAGKKRVRPNDGANAGATGAAKGKLALETPARTDTEGRPLLTPGTLRTVRRGEPVFSKNGSPVDQAEEGDLVATVSKKRKGNDREVAAAAFDINVGDGRYISLSDPTATENLTEDMKNTAMSQLKILQDQMASLMAQLGN